MTEIYRKRGSNVRFEQRLGSPASVVRTSENGEASISDGMFRTRTISSSKPDALPDSPPHDVFNRIATLVEMPPFLERATVTEGVAHHWWTDGTIEREWSEASARIHVALCHPVYRVRCLGSLGGTSAGAIDLEPLASVARALGRLNQGRPLSGPITVELQPQVTAELWPVLLELLKKGGAESAPGRARLKQSIHPAFSVDGTGARIEEADLFGEDGPVRLPNIFRPSYRIRPVRAAFHLELTAMMTSAAKAECRGVGLIEPISIVHDMIRASILWDNAASAFTGSIAMPFNEWIDRLSAVDDEHHWFPVGSGSYGRRVVIGGVEVEPIRD